MESSTKQKNNISYSYNLIVSDAGGRKIATRNPSPTCYKCGKPLEHNDWVYFCEMNNKIFCDAEKCKKSACDFEFIKEEHADHYGVLFIEGAKE